MSQVLRCDLCGKIIEDPISEGVERYVTKRIRFHYWRDNMRVVDVHESCRKKLFGIEDKCTPPRGGSAQSGD